MKRYISLIIALLVSLVAANSFAYNPPPAPANGGYVVDQAGKLSESQIRTLNQKIERISQTTKNEFGILLLQNMGGDNIEDVANTTYKAWGVGKRGLDNGCLIVVAIKERKSRIETGKGVEGEVTDLQANDILKKNLNPHLKQNDFFGAFDDTLNALSGLMESRIAQKADPKPVADPVVPATNNANSDSAGLVVAFLLLLGVGVIVFLIVGEVKRRREREAELEAEMARDRAKKRREHEAHVEAERIRITRENVGRKSDLKVVTPFVNIPSIPKRTSTKPDPLKTSQLKPTVVMPSVETSSRPVRTGARRAAAASTAAADDAAHLARLRREREEREEQEARRRKRERDEEDRRRRDEESSSSSSSSFDWGSSSGGSDSGGGFGGGDSGGGGSSSDW